LYAYRIHGLDVVSQAVIPAWQPITTPVKPWRLQMDMNSRSLSSQVPPRAGPSQWRWNDARTLLVMTGTPPGYPQGTPAAARFEVDPVRRRLTVEHTQGLAQQNADLVARWFLPDIARRERHAVPLHACAVLSGDGAVLLLGDTGAGKSTLATGLVAAGARVLGDEPLCVAADVVWPGPRVLRVGEGTVREFLGLKVPVDSAGKGVLHAQGDVLDAAPLVALILLAPRRPDGPDLEINRLVQASALTSLMRVRYGGLATRRAQDLTRLAEVVKRVPVLTVSLRDDLGGLLTASAALLDRLHAP
jgi:hypothetical protein